MCRAHPGRTVPYVMLPSQQVAEDARGEHVTVRLDMPREDQSMQGPLKSPWAAGRQSAASSQDSCGPGGGRH